MKFINILKTIISEMLFDPDPCINNHIDEYYSIYYNIKHLT